MLSLLILQSTVILEQIFLFYRLDDFKLAHQLFVDDRGGCGVIPLTVVAWRGEDSDEAAVGEELVAVLDDLVRTANQNKVMLLIEFLHDVRSEGVTNSALVLTPSSNVLVGITPKKITEQSVVWHVRWSVQAHYLFKAVEFRLRPPCMHIILCLIMGLTGM